MPAPWPTPRPSRAHADSRPPRVDRQSTTQRQRLSASKPRPTICTVSPAKVTDISHTGQIAASRFAAAAAKRALLAADLVVIREGPQLHTVGGRPRSAKASGVSVPSEITEWQWRSALSGVGHRVNFMSHPKSRARCAAGAGNTSLFEDRGRLARVRHRSAESRTRDAAHSFEPQPTFSGEHMLHFSNRRRTVLLGAPWAAAP